MPKTSAPALLDTERLILRPFRPQDAGALCSLWQRNRERFQDSFPDAVEQLCDHNDGPGYIAARAADWNACTGFWYGLWERSCDRLVGQIHVKRLDWELGRTELAYLIDAAEEGKGLVTEALGRTIAMCFDELGLHKIFLRTIVGNERSAKLARRCGFVLEGTLRGEFLAAGRTRVDLHYFGLLSTDARPF